MREITRCEVCGSGNLPEVLNLGRHPLPDDLVPIGVERECKTYPIEVLFCDTCKTAHQRFQVEKHLLFSPTYHYRARQTQDVLDGMVQFVNSCEKQGPLAGLKVLDVGCNDGSLLNVFRERGAKTFGIEPTDAVDDAADAGHTVTRAFLDYASAHEFVSEHGHPDIITFTNVFAHIEHLHKLLDCLFILKKPSTMIVIENHYLGAVLDRHQFDTFYHEHPRTYSFTSFVKIASDLAMHIAHADFPARYGGNIRVFLKPGAHSVGTRPYIPNEMGFGSRLQDLGEQVIWWREKKRHELLHEFKMHGKLSLAAFPGRAAIALRLLNLDERHVWAIYEKPGSKKIGCYAPGTSIPIISDELYPMNDCRLDTPLVNMAWHIPAEVEKRWRGKGFTGRIIQSVGPDDFK